VAFSAPGRHAEAERVEHPHPTDEPDAGGGEHRVAGPALVYSFEYGTAELKLDGVSAEAD
jgi:hypothetical protein